MPRRIDWMCRRNQSVHADQLTPIKSKERVVEALY